MLKADQIQKKTKNFKMSIGEAGPIEQGEDGSGTIYLEGQIKGYTTTSEGYFTIEESYSFLSLIAMSFQDLQVIRSITTLSLTMLMG